MNTECDFKDQLTNESLLKRFNNQFELVQYAINLAENSIKRGREPDVFTDSQNMAYQILAEIAVHKDDLSKLDEVCQEEPEEEEEFVEEKKSAKAPAAKSRTRGLR